MSVQTQKADDEQANEQAAIHVETGGDLWRSTTDLLSVLVDECKVRFDADDDEDPEVTVRAVDPANVGMVDVTVPAEAFDHYEVPEETVLGLPLDELTTITDYARKGGNGDNPGDPVIVEQVGKRIYVRVEPDDKWNRTGSFFEIPPDSIRQEPDLPDLDLPWRGDVEPSNLRDALDGIKSRFDYAALSASPGTTGDGSLGNGEAAYFSVYAADTNDDGEIRKEDEFRSDEKLLHASPGEDPVTSLFSLDYLRDMLQGVVAAGFERTTLDLGGEFPVKIHFSGSRFGISGEYMLAPRIQSGEDEDSTADLSRTWGDRFDGTDEDTENDADDEDDAVGDETDASTEEDEDEQEQDLPGCVSGDCENDADPEAVEEGYPFCEEHDRADNRELYDDLPEESFEDADTDEEEEN